ncbi:MAG: type II secretion system F family protein [Candidatus Oxydemutatoraceae bacterium WSBS_2016_MAG_OTU14]
MEKYYDEQLETSIARLLSLLEPVLIVWIAICIGWIVVTMYLPIFNLGYAF